MWKWVTVIRIPKLFTDRMKRPIWASIWVLIDGLETNKIQFHILMSAEYERTENYGWKPDTKPSTILEYYQVAHQSKKSGVELTTPCTRRVMQGHSFWLAVRLNTSLGMRFLYPTPMITLWDDWYRVSIGWPIWARYSGVWTPIKEDCEKSRKWLEAGSADGRLKALASLLPPLPRYPESSTWLSLATLVCSKRTRG